MLVGQGDRAVLSAGPASDVLIACAQLSVRKALERLLESLDLNVRSVVSAAQARREVLARRPGLLIAALTLPDQSGLELCRTLRPGELPVVLLGDIGWSAAQAAGAVGTLTLPLDAPQLRRLLRDVLGTPQAADKPAPSGHTGAALAQHLLSRPGVLAVGLYGAAGELAEHLGSPLPENLGEWARRCLEAARWLAQDADPTDAARPTVQLEYAGRCLLLFELPGPAQMGCDPSGSVVACLLQGSASASLLKYWLHTPHPQP